MLSPQLDVSKSKLHYFGVKPVFCAILGGLKLSFCGAIHRLAPPIAANHRKKSGHVEQNIHLLQAIPGLDVKAVSPDSCSSENVIFCQYWISALIRRSL